MDTFRMTLPRPPDFSNWGMWTAYAGTKYKPNEKDIELIGVKNPQLWWAVGATYDNSALLSGSTGLTIDTFDYTTRADSAKIKLVNNSGSTQTLTAVAIKGEPVMRYSGALGLRHDSFVDYDDIYANGEALFEFGNNYVVSTTQLEQLADYWWKFLRVNRHIYTITLPGVYYWIEPGEWYYLEVGDAGQREYIRSTVECYQIAVEAGANMAPFTTISFREVEQDWVKDSGAIARCLSTGDPRQLPVNTNRLIVAAPEYLGTADYYCEATSAQTVIQAAIDRIGISGGGVVELTEGKFNTTGPINLNYDNVVLCGRGYRTVVEKNFDDEAIQSVGTVGTQLTGVCVSSLKVARIATDTSEDSWDLVYFTYSNDIIVEKVWAENSGRLGFNIYRCQDVTIMHNTVVDCLNSGISLSGSAGTPMRAKIVSNVMKTNHSHGLYIYELENSVIYGNQIEENTSCGVYVALCKYNSIINNIMDNNSIGFSWLSGIYVIQSSDNIFSGNVSLNHDGMGILVYNTSCITNIFTGNRATNNTEGNFVDNGASTIDSGNLWT